MPAAFTKWTVDLLDALPESNERFELIDGELYVTPSPGFEHQSVVGELFVRLVIYIRDAAARSCRAVISPSDVWREPRQENRVQPDVYVVGLNEGARPPYPFHLRHLLLAVEVASPGNPLLDYHVKRAVYAAERVGEYWIFNPEQRTVTRFVGRDDRGTVVSDQLEWRPAGAAEAFVLDLPAFFDQALR
jgi:Uma2 family endonuclease